MKLCVRLTVEVSRQTPDSTTTSSPRLSDLAPTTNDTPLGLPLLPKDQDHAARLSGIAVSLARIMATLTRMEKGQDIERTERAAMNANSMWRS